MRLPESILDQEPAAIVFDNVKLWLNENGHTYGRSIFAKECIKAFLFHFFVNRPSYMKELVLTAGKNESGAHHIYLHFLASLPFDSLEQSIQINDLNRAFTHGVAIPLLPNPSVHTEFFTQDILHDRSLYEHVQEIALEEGDLQYLGTIKFREEQS